MNRTQKIYRKILTEIKKSSTLISKPLNNTKQRWKKNARYDKVSLKKYVNGYATSMSPDLGQISIMTSQMPIFSTVWTSAIVFLVLSLNSSRRSLPRMLTSLGLSLLSSLISADRPLLTSLISADRPLLTSLASSVRPSP